MVRGYVPEHVWQVLASNFFCQLCAKELSHIVEAETLLKKGAGNGMSDFISWFKQKVPSNLART